jgi:hypothetical protein
VCGAQGGICRVNTFFPSGSFFSLLSQGFISPLVHFTNHYTTHYVFSITFDCHLQIYPQFSSLYSLGADPQKTLFPSLSQKYLNCCLFVAAGTCLPRRCLAMNVYSDFTIPAFGRHITVLLLSSLANVGMVLQNKTRPLLQYPYPFTAKKTVNFSLYLVMWLSIMQWRRKVDWRYSSMYSCLRY